jgi:hypothetical protein
MPNYFESLLFEAFALTVCIEALFGDQLCECGSSIQHSGYCPHLHTRGLCNKCHSHMYLYPQTVPWTIPACIAEGMVGGVRKSVVSWSWAVSHHIPCCVLVVLHYFFIVLPQICDLLPLICVVGWTWVERVDMGSLCLFCCRGWIVAGFQITLLYLRLAVKED